MNIEKNYTEGPWHLSIPKYKGKYAGFNTSRGVCYGIYATGDELECIAQVPKDELLFNSTQNNEANAKLISQAPRMAEMLIEQYKEALEEFEFYTKINETDQIIYWQNKAAQIKEVLTAAGIVITE